MPLHMRKMQKSPRSAQTNIDKVSGRVYGEFIEIDVKEWSDE